MSLFICSVCLDICLGIDERIELPRNYASIKPTDGGSIHILVSYCTVKILISNVYACYFKQLPMYSIIMSYHLGIAYTSPLVEEIVTHS